MPFSYQGNKTIVVLDKEELDTGALQVATLWARWVVRRELCEEDQEFDTEAIEVLVDEAARALNRHATIKRCHSTAQKKIAEAPYGPSSRRNRSSTSLTSDTRPSTSPTARSGWP